jgi:hypothetical protein
MAFLTRSATVGAYAHPEVPICLSARCSIRKRPKEGIPRNPSRLELHEMLGLVNRGPLAERFTGDMCETSAKDKEAETVGEVAAKETIQGAPRQSRARRGSQAGKGRGYRGAVG